MRLLPRILRGGFLLRAAVRELAGIRQQLSRQNDALERLAAQFAPETVSAMTQRASTTEVADTGVSFLDTVDAGIVEDFVTRTEQATGHTPTDEEVVAYLADEKTQALAERLKAREAAVLLARADRERLRAEQAG